MQTSVPDLMDLSKEPDSSFELYGPDSRKPGTFAANCLLARRLAERGVRFVQLYHRGWDQHSDLPAGHRAAGEGHRSALRRPDQDLKQRGMLDDTLVVWGGEFGRTVYCQGKLTRHQLRPRPSPALLHHVDGGRRHQTRHSYRQDRRLLLQHRGRSRPHPRPAGDHPALPGRRPHQADVSSSRAAISV